VKGFFTGFTVGLRRPGQLVAGIVNTVLLAAVYVVGVSLSWLFSAMSGAELIEKKLGKKTYWSNLKLEKDYYRQF